MASFFKSGDSPDPIYRALRDGTEDHYVSGRAYLEQLWERGAAYVDADALEKATRDLASVFWELALAHAFKSAGLRLAERKDLRYRNNKGPDLFVENAWVEAIVVRPGTGPDALRTPELMKVYSYDPDGVVLRLRQAIRDKSVKLDEYRREGIIKPGQAAVIAISGLLLPHRFSGITPPEIVRAVYPVNHLVLEMDRATRKLTGAHLQYRDRVKKTLGAEVETDVFLNPECSHVSAVLFAEDCWIHPSHPPGTDFRIVHNVMAETPLPSGWLSLGHEYWWRDEGDTAHIETRSHTASRDTTT